MGFRVNETVFSVSHCIACSDHENTQQRCMCADTSGSTLLTHCEQGEKSNSTFSSIKKNQQHNTFQQMPEKVHRLVRTISDCKRTFPNEPTHRPGLNSQSSGPPAVFVQTGAARKCLHGNRSASAGLVYKSWETGSPRIQKTTVDTYKQACVFLTKNDAFVFFNSLDMLLKLPL